MGYNSGMVRATQQRTNSSLRDHHRQNQSRSAPFVSPADLINGQYRGRLAPAGEKNPHGFLKYWNHDIPLTYPDVHGNFKKVTYQCPRSSNYDPIPAIVHPDGYEEFNTRCVCCEIDEYTGTRDLDDNGDPIDGTSYAEQIGLPDHLKDILGILHRHSSRASMIVVPMALFMEVAAKTPYQKNDGSTGVDVTYKPSPTNLMPVIMKFRPWGHTIWTGIENAIAQNEHLGDPVSGHYFTITKQSDGKGPNGYRLDWDFQPSPLPAGMEIDMGQFNNLMDWGKANRKRATRRWDFNQQVATLESCEWVHEMRQAGVPITDADAQAIEARNAVLGGVDPESLPF